MKKLKFPADESAHNHVIEWWYWNGHLHTKNGHRYSYMHCLFKADIKRVKFPFLKGTSHLPFRHFYFTHSLITDINAKKFYPDIKYFVMISRDSFPRTHLYANYTEPEMFEPYFNNVLEATGRSTYRIKTEQMHFKYTRRKKPLLEGGEGFVRLPHGRWTYYYSLTNLDTRGDVMIRGKSIPVVGKSWMDHQWSNAGYEKNKWSWFSIQLNNNTEFVCIQYGTKKVMNLIGGLNRQGKQTHADDIQITPLAKQWRSPKTGAVYPLEWRIESKKLGLDLSLKAYVSNQEMLYGTINYWEGPLSVEGTQRGKSVQGEAFAELVGYPSEYDNIKFFKASFEDFMHRGFDLIRHRKR